MNSSLQDIGVELLSPNPWNPNVVDPINLDKLKNAIANEGVLKPLLVREQNGEYEILDGEHRWRVAKSLNLPTLPARVFHDMDDATAKKATLIGNSRYGEDDLDLFKAMIESDDGLNLDDLVETLPIDAEMLNGFFGGEEMDLDNLDDDDDIDQDTSTGSLETEAVRSHKVLRFRVQTDKVHLVEKAISQLKHANDLSHQDEMTNNGDALIAMSEGVIDG